MILRVVSIGFLSLIICGNAQSQSRRADSYDVLLHSKLIEEQRTALTVILRDQQAYVPRIQRSLRDYPRILVEDRTAANRAVYVAALVRDTTFPAMLAKILGNRIVLSECEYACSVVFALTIQACFANWTLPSNLDSQLTTVSDLKESVRRVPHIALRVGSIDDVVQGPDVERRRKEIEGKSEAQLIQLAGPNTSSNDTRVLAANRLETLASTGENRIDLYLLAMNDIRDDASKEYLTSIYESIYRAELANAKTKSR